jgi:Tfp pilus assembly protein PilO
MDKKTKQQINNLLNKYFKWVILLVVVFILITGYFWVVKPKYEETMASLEERLDLEKQEYLSKKKKMQKIEKLAMTYNEINDRKIKRVNHLLPTDYSYESLFTEINALVSNNGMLLTDIGIKESEAKDSDEKGAEKDLPNLIKITEIEVEVMGVNYSGLKNLLSDFENNLRLLDITGVNFDPGSSSVSLVMQTYSFNKEEFDINTEINL